MQSPEYTFPQSSEHPATTIQRDRRDWATVTARAYVASLRRTDQYRKSYWYIVVFDEASAPRGHQMHLTRNSAINRALRDFNGNSVIVKGSDC